MQINVLCTIIVHRRINMLALLLAFERGRKDDEYTNVTAKKDKKKTTRSMRTGKQNKKYDKEKEKREGGMQCWMDGWMDGWLPFA